MLRATFQVTLFASVALAAASCSQGSSSAGSSDAGRAATPDGSAPDAACEGGAPGHPTEPPPNHRAAAAACPRSSTGMPSSDGGSCTRDADCPASTPRCLQGLCGNDACLTDSDCPAQTACLCGAQRGSWVGSNANACLPAACHVDADCGAGQYCVPNPVVCGFDGLACTTAHDECADATKDCVCGGNACVYAPMVSRWTCATVSCNG